MQINRETFYSPPAIFAIYVIAASLIILLFRLVFPGEVSPLPVFSRDWRLIRGLIDIIALFPAVAFSALVVPFGLASEETRYSDLSARLFKHMMTPLMTAICAAGLYVVLFFLVLPLAQNYEGNLRFRGDVYDLAKERAQTHAQAGEWLEASQLIGVCDTVWYQSPDIAPLRTEVEIHLEELRFEEDKRLAGGDHAGRLNSASISAIPGQREPLDAAEAITLGEAALSDERPFDAHWFATIAGRIAKADSPEKTGASRLAARAWNKIESQETTRGENRVHSIYLLKLSGYEAMVSGDWIRAYYIFKQLLELTPFDPDAENFFAASEKGTKECAFFMDEMEILPGETLSGVVFSLPARGRQERAVMRVASLSTYPDYAYAIGIEYMVFNSQGHLLLNLQAPYAKIRPITLNDQPQTLFLMRALDRNDSTKRWEPEWEAQNRIVYQPETAQITLTIDYETFLMLSEIRQDLPSLYITDLFAASRIAREMGYVPEVFQAEILNRLGTCVFFLPMAVIVIIIGWNFRARHYPRYFFTLLLPVLPVVFNGMVYLYRTVFNIVGISLILSLGFSLAFTLFIVILVVFFILALIFMAFQHE
jgi:hypothetical protein